MRWSTAILAALFTSVSPAVFFAWIHSLPSDGSTVPSGRKDPGVSDGNRGLTTCLGLCSRHAEEPSTLIGETSVEIRALGEAHTEWRFDSRAIISIADWGSLLSEHTGPAATRHVVSSRPVVPAELARAHPLGVSERVGPAGLTVQPYGGGTISSGGLGV